MIPVFVYCLILFELFTVAWIDFRTEKISNKWILVNLIGSVILHLTLGSYYLLSWEIIIFPLGFILFGFLLFLINVMGAGDSKFLASLFLLIPLALHTLFFEKLVLATLVTGLILFLYRIAKNGSKLKAFLHSHHWQGVKETLQSRFSYAPVILLAWLVLGAELWR